MISTMAHNIDPSLVASLPQRTVETQLRSPRGLTSYVFRGASLFDYATAAGLMPPEGALANQYFFAAADDGFAITLAMAEVAPGFSDKQVVLATEQNGEAVRKGVRLVVPGDDLGGRSVYGLATLEVRSVPSVDLSSAPVSAFVSLQGGLDRPDDVDRDALEAMPSTAMETRPYKSHGEHITPATHFAGVRVWHLLDGAGIRLDENAHEPFLRKIVVARDAEGYAVVIAGGEIEPRFQNAPFIVALTEAGRPIDDDDGGLRLIAPYDLAGARSVKGIASLEVREG
jgi:hypothetical protein